MHKSLDEFKFRPDTTTNTRVICPCASEILMYNVVTTLAPSFLIGSFSYLQVIGKSIGSRTSLKFGQIGRRTAELAALERLEKSQKTYNGRNLVNTLAPLFLIWSTSFLHVRRTCMKAWMNSNFGKFATELLPLIDVRIEFLFNILKTNGLIKTKCCIIIIIDKIYFDIVNRCFSQIGKRVTALDWRQKLVFAQYLEKELTKWDQSLYSHYQWQDLSWYCKSLFFANLQQSFGHWLMSEFGFYSISWERIDRIRPNFVYTSSLTRSMLVK